MHESIKLQLPHFQEVVQQAWSQTTSHTEPFHRLGHKLFITGKALKAWSRTIIFDARLKLHMAQEVILRLDTAQEHRALSNAEFQLCTKLKRRILGWAVIEKARRKQCSRIVYLREGDANTKFFHLKANARRRKNYIQRLKTGRGWAVNYEDKMRIITNHISAIMDTPLARTSDLNWEQLHVPDVDMSSLDAPFTEQEIHAAISLKHAGKW